MADGSIRAGAEAQGTSTRRAQARVNVAAIERNCARLLTELRGGAALCAVVKANGYGHGAAQSARAALSGGASWLAVADAHEACELREAGLREPRILVMGALSPVELREALAADADVVVWNEDYLQAVAAAGGDASTSSSTPAWDGSAHATRLRHRAWRPRRVRRPASSWRV
jgi:alanine racemase